MEVVERVYTANGIRLHVARWGADHGQRPLVLLHGIWDSWRTFLPIAPALGARRQVHAVDLRGHGASDKPEDGYSFDTYATDIAALLPQLTSGPVDVLGFSLGGLVAARLAARGSPQVARLLLEDPPLPSARRARQWIEGFQALLELKHQPLDEIVEEFELLYPARTMEAHRASAEALMNTADGPFLMFIEPTGGQIGLIDDLRRIDIPALIARADPAMGGALPDEGVAALREARANLPVVDFPGAGHAIHAERPDAFIAAVEGYLGDSPATRGRE